MVKIVDVVKDPIVPELGSAVREEILVDRGVLVVDVEWETETKLDVETTDPVVKLVLVEANPLVEILIEITEVLEIVVDELPLELVPDWE